jgi:ornithine cyclodeaminase
MKVFSADDVHRYLDYPGLVEALRAMFKDGVDVLQRYAFTQSLPDGSQNSWILLPAWQFNKHQGIKLVSVYPDNEKRGLASVQGLYVLMDGQSGVAVACADGAALTVRKTAANSALAATYLAREESRTMLMVGAGSLAPHLIQAHCAVRPIERVYVWNRNSARAAQVVADLQQTKNFKIAVEVTTDLEKAVRECDLISCATMSNEPLIQGSWLKKGVHLDLVGGYRHDMREADDEAVRRSRIFVDAQSTAADCGDVSVPLAAGLIKDTDITDTFQLARGQRPGRQREDEITLFKSGGGGHEDLASAQYLLQKSESIATAGAI